MAALGIALAGAALGQAAFGLPQLGFLIGSVVGTLLFPPPSQETVVEGPRLGDLSVSASTYGTAIPLGYGTVRMSGNMIWSTGIQERKHTETQGGGKGGLGGGPKQTQITYTYYVDMAMGFAATEASDVLRIWADGKLILDRTSTNGARLSGLRYRFYPGNETQVPDSTIEADKGSGQVPGHRGLCYVVFDNLPLKNFGNRVPNITAEISFNSSTENSKDKGTELSPSIGFQVDTLMVDYVRRRVYLHNTASSGTLRVHNLDTMDEVRRVTNIDFSAAGSANHAGRFTGNIYTGDGTLAITKKYDPDSFAQLASFGSGFNTGNSTTAFGYAKILLEGQAIKPTGGTRNILLQVASFGSDIGLLDADTFEYIWHYDSPANTVAGANTPIFPPLGETYFWIGDHSSDNTDINIKKVTVTALANYDSALGVTNGVTFETIGTITADTWNNDGSGFMVGPIVDQEDEGLIFIKDLNVGTGSQIFKWIEGEGVVWSTNVTGSIMPIQRRHTALNSLVTNGKYGWTDSAGNASVIDTVSGEVLVNGYDISNAGGLNVGPSQAACFWDGDAEALITQDTNGAGDIAKIFLDRASGSGVTLSSVVEDLASRAGYSIAEDLVTTALDSDNVRGYVVGKQMTYRQALEPLAQAFFFEGTESDDKIKFVKRGGSSVKTISQGNLIELDQDRELLSEDRHQEVELPERLSVLFLDYDNDYQQGAQSSKRIRQPTPAMRSRVEQSTSLPLVLTATESLQIAEKLLFSAWNERTSYKWKGTPDLAVLDPTDIVTVNLDSGASFEIRVSQLVLGADLSVELDGISESAVTFSSTAVGQGALGIPQKLPPPPLDTRLFQFNIPLLRDVDDTSGTALRMYYGMNGYVSGWDGGALLQSTDSGVTFDEISRAFAGIEWGTVAEALPDTETPFQTDETTELTVFMQEGDLSSVTETQFLADANVALVGSPSTNVWEVIAYRDVTEVSEGLYTVSGLIRGKRGTDVFVGEHSTNELFLPITSSTVFSYLLTLAQRNVSLPYKGVAFGQVQEQVSATEFTGLGRDLMPYAPVHLDAVVDGSSNIDLSWVRRTRIGGELVDGIGTVPLGETSEVYEVDIYNGAGDTVLRTLGSGGTLTTNSVQYDNADIVTDFGGVPSALTFEVFQVSSVVGRGFGRKVTITF